MSPLSRIGTFVVLLFMMVVGAATVAQSPAHDADQRVYPPLPIPPPTSATETGLQLPLPIEDRAEEALIPWSRLVYYARAGGNVSEAARLSGIPRQNLYVRMKRWGVVT